MNKRKILQKNLTYFSDDDIVKPWGQDGPNISETIEYFNKLGFKDLTQKMLRDMDPIIDPTKRKSGFRYFDHEALSRTKVVMALKAVGFTNKRVVHMFQLRSEIISLIEQLSPGLDKVTLQGMSDNDTANVLWRKTQEYLSILYEVASRVYSMRKIIRIADDFYRDEDQRARSLAGTPLLPIPSGAIL